MANKKRLIDAEKAYETVVDLSGQADTKSAYAAFWKAGKEIRKLPTVDAVEVVRCKDCKWYRGNECRKTDALLDVKPDDFCSYGVRRDENESCT